ncbi:MAG: DUF1549 domain-containing protein [Verrucomicrobiota bacterium]
MKLFAVPFLFFAGLTAPGSLLAALTPEQVRQLPPPASHAIDFSREIQPILETSCTKCHGHGKEKGGFRIDTRETFLKGGDTGPAVVIGKSADSLLIELVMGFDPDAVMPKKGSKLKPEQIGLLRAWIDQGLKWDQGAWLGKVEPKNLKPVSLKLPQNKKFSNPVDGLLDVYFASNKVKWPQPVGDRVFARRVYLDIIGLLPPAAELEQFVADKSDGKREKLVKKLLSDNRNYAEHWMTFWNDMLRNDYKGTGYIDGGRKQITQWLFSALSTNMSYDKFVAQLVNPTGESEGFTKGIVWRGVVNASQVPQMQAAQNISQVFMGINMKCASCHDSFINDWQLSDAYALANIYSDEQLELFECDKPTGKKAATKFLYPEFGEINSTNKAARLEQLAECVTSPKNGRLSRTFVNRLWGKFMGRALVEPVDDMEKPAWNSDLLDFLAEDFVAHKYDVKHLIEQIVTSRAYQLPAVNVGETEKDFVFRGPSVRRLSAEQFRDALTTLTGIGYPTSDAKIEMVSSGKKQEITSPKWIWNSKDAETKGKAGAVYFRKTITLNGPISDALAVVTCDNTFALFVNGQQAGAGKDWTHPETLDIAKLLHTGENVVAVEAVNNLPGNVAPTPQTAIAGTENPAGLLFYLQMHVRENDAVKRIEMVSDNSWLATEQKIAGWEKGVPAADKWASAVELGAISILPWRLSNGAIVSKLAENLPGTFRAALVAADSLMVALGRPNREQVVTTRPSTATTLQALEMTNGDTLSEILKRGAKDLATQNAASRDLVQRIYEQGVGRKPTGAELQTAEAIVGEPVKKEGVEDLLWAVTMLPEFQLIY